MTGYRRVRAPALVKYDCALVDALVEGVEEHDRLCLRADIHPAVGDELELKMELPGLAAGVYVDLRVETITRRVKSNLITARAQFPRPGDAEVFGRWVREHGVRVLTPSPSPTPAARRSAPGETVRLRPRPQVDGSVAVLGLAASLAGWFSGLWDRLTAG